MKRILTIVAVLLTLLSGCANEAAKPPTETETVNDSTTDPFPQVEKETTSPQTVSQESSVNIDSHEESARDTDEAKTVQTESSSPKQTVKTAKGTVKSTEKAVKTAEKTSKAAIKTAETTATATQKAAETAAKAAQKAAEIARRTAIAVYKAAVAAAKAIAAAIKAIITAIEKTHSGYCCGRMGCRCCRSSYLFDCTHCGFLLWHLLFQRG